MTGPIPDPPPFPMIRVAPPRWLRPAIAGYLLVELVILVLFARRVGLGATLAVLAVSALIGLFQLSRLPRRVGERGLDLLSAVLFIVPGLLSTLFALALTLPGIRRVVRRVTRGRLDRWSTTAAAQQVVVRGTVIDPEHPDAQPGPAEPGAGPARTPPRMIEGKLLDRSAQEPAAEPNPDPERNHTERDHTGRDHTGRDDSGQESSGQESSGQESSGQESSGRDSSGRDSSGHDSSGHDEGPPPRVG